MARVLAGISMYTLMFESSLLLNEGSSRLVGIRDRLRRKNWLGLIPTRDLFLV